MSSISVRKTISTVFSSYFKNFSILAPLGIFLGLFYSLTSHIQALINYCFLTNQDMAATNSFSQPTQESAGINHLIARIKEHSIFLKNTHRLDYTFFSVAMFLLLFALYYYLYFAFLKALLSLPNNQNLTIKNLFVYDKSIIKAMSISLLNNLIMGGVTGLLIGLLIAFYFLLNKFFNIGAISVSYTQMIPFLGFLLLIIVGLAFYTTLRLSYAVTVTLDKNIAIKNAFKTSWNLTKKSALKIFFIFVIALLIHLFVNIIMSLVFSLLKLYSMPLLIVTLHSIILSMTSIIIIALFFTTTYKELSHNN